MQNSNGYEKYQKVMLEFVQPILKPIVDEKLKDKDFYIEQTNFKFYLFNGFTEISKSYDTLKLIERFIELEPPKDEQINYSNYLIYHIHNYLQEMYILKERLNSYATKIQRQYKKVLDKDLLNNIFESLFNIIKTSLNNITGENGVRHKHVHQEKFNNDEDLKWLSSATFLAQFHEEFKLPSKQAYLNAQNKWYDIINKNNQEIVELLDMYFNILYHIVSVNNKVVLPEEYMKSSNNIK